MKIFLYSSSVYSCHLFLIYSASFRSIQFLSLIVPIFLEEISSLSHSVVFLYFFAMITEEGFLIFSCYSLELWIKNIYIFPFLLYFSLLFFSELFVRPPQTAILLSCISISWVWSWSLSPVQCHELLSIVHQAHCLSDLVLSDDYYWRRDAENKYSPSAREKYHRR